MSRVEKEGWRKVILSTDNADEAALIKDMEVYPVSCIRDLVYFCLVGWIYPA